MAVEITNLIDRLPGEWNAKSDAQRMCLESPADIVLFGGSAGSLKSETMLVDALEYYDRPKYAAIIFRRTYDELKFLIERSENLYRNRGGKLNHSDRTWRWPWGSYIEFRYLDKDADIFKRQGPEYQFCTEVGTPVLMADGSYKPVEDLVPGSLVQTLDGPQPVTRTCSPRRTKCVQAMTSAGSQVQSFDHRFLTASGEWQSYKTCLADKSKKYQYSLQSSLPNLEKYPEVSTPEFQPRDQELASEQVRSLQRQSLSKVSSVCLKDNRTDSVGFGDAHPNTSQLLALTVQLAHYAHPPQQVSKLATDPTGHYALTHDWPTYEAPNCRGDYQFSLRSCDEQLHPLSTDGQSYLPSLEHVEDAKTTGHNIYKFSSAQKYTQLPQFSYLHPYTKVERQSRFDVDFVPCELTPVGLRDVVDITIATSSQYITMGGFINANCGFDESTHFLDKQVRYLINSRMRSTEGIRTKVRLATNPGNRGNTWHKLMFMGPKCFHCLAQNKVTKYPKGTKHPYTLYHDAKWMDGVDVGMSTMFIPGKVTDHTLFGVGGGIYAKKLRGLSIAYQKALLEGCWESFEGQYFDCFSHQVNTISRLEVTKMMKPWWPCWVSIDYGFSHATAAYLWTKSPDGKVYTIEEYVIHRRKATDVALDLQKLWDGYNIKAWYLSPDAFKHDGTDDFSRAEMMSQATGIGYDPAYNERISGAMLMYQYLQDGLWRIGDNCDLLITTMPSRVHDDEKRAEDVKKIDGEDEDDSYDAGRYGLASHINPGHRPDHEEVLEKVTSDDPTCAMLQYQMAMAQFEKKAQPIIWRGGARSK